MPNLSQPLANWARQRSSCKQNGHAHLCSCPAKRRLSLSGNLVVCASVREFDELSVYWQSHQHQSHCTLVLFGRHDVGGTAHRHVRASGGDKHLRVQEVTLRALGDWKHTPWPNPLIDINTSAIKPVERVRLRVAAPVEYRAIFADANKGTAKSILTELVNLDSSIPAHKFTGGDWSSSQIRGQWLITGFLTIPKDDALKLLLLSGKRGIFLNIQEAANTPKRIRWFGKQDNESNERYFRRCSAEAQLFASARVARLNTLRHISSRDQDGQVDDAQSHVDFEWLTLTAEMSELFQIATSIAMQNIPAWADQAEISRAQELSRSSAWKTSSPHYQRRPTPRSKAVDPIKFLKARRRLGRITELLKKCERNKIDEAKVLWRRLRQGEAFHIDADVIEAFKVEKEHLAQHIKTLENVSFRQRVEKWRQSMVSSVSVRSLWLKKEIPVSPVVQGEHQPSNQTSPAEAALRNVSDYKSALSARVRIEVNERERALNSITETLNANKSPQGTYGNGPDWSVFRKQIGRARGVAGIDGWSLDEIKALPVGCLQLVWSTMRGWGRWGHCPSILKHTRVAHIPKPNKIHDGKIQPEGFRP